MHYFNFNIGDWIKNTSHLEPEEEFIYFKLILEYYNTESPLDLDVNKLARKIKMKKKVELIKEILDEFFLETENGWENNRCEEELSAYKSKAENARNNGKKGGRPKANSNPEKTQSVILANPEESKSKTNHKPITNNHKPKNNNQELDDEFEAFWKQTKFPKRKQDTKGDIKKKFIKLIKNEKLTYEEILKASNNFAIKHEGDNWSIGMRRFLDSKENIDPYLHNTELALEEKEREQRLAYEATLQEIEY